MNVLIWVEHDNVSVKDATLAVVTAASQLGEVTALVAGSGCDAAATAAAQIAGVTKVLKADDAAYANTLAENVAPLIAGLMPNFDAFVAPSTTTGKNIAPRVAALLDVMQISDILSVEGPKTFTRPIYAGNAIATVESSDAKLVITVRGTAFAKAANTGGSASVEAVSGANGQGGDAGRIGAKHLLPLFEFHQTRQHRSNESQADRAQNVVHLGYRRVARVIGCGDSQ